MQAPVLMPMPMPSRRGCSPGPGLGGELGVEGGECGVHGDRGRHRLAGVVGFLERRVPERHHGVAHVFVDGAAMRQHHLRQRVEQAVDEADQALGIVLHALRDGGEAAHVAEQHGECAPLAAELQLRGVGGQPLDQHRRQILRKGLHDAAPSRLSPA